jgi:hypothetical protein
MARLHEYLNDRGFYIKHSFLADHRLHHVTYQVSPDAEEILVGQGLKDGDLLPDEIFHALRDSGKISTDRQGVEGIPLCSERTTGDVVDPDHSIARGAEQKSAHSADGANKRVQTTDLNNLQNSSASEIRKELKAQNSGWSAKELRRAVNERLSRDSGATTINAATEIEALFERLSDAARNWAGVLSASHPSARVVDFREGTDGELHYTLEGIPEHFWEQLVRVAAMHDGTDFFENLDRSYESKGAGTKPKDSGRPG